MTGFVKRFFALFTLIGVELVVIAAVAMVSATVFLTMAKLVFVDQNNALDAGAFAFAESHVTIPFTRFMRFVTYFASRDFLIVSSVSLGLYLMFFKKHRWYSVKVPIIAAGSSLLNQAMKLWFNRPRPATAFYEQPGFSFPSGHAMIGGAFYGLLIYLVWKEVKVPLLRWSLIGLLSIWVFLIGYSRVYLHVHYASDVLAGWSAGFMFLIISLLLLRRIEKKFARKAPAILDNNT